MFFLLLTSFISANDKLCKLCLEWGKPALEMARAGVPEDQIREKANKKCKELEVIYGEPIYSKFCFRTVEKMLPKLIIQAQHEEYPVEYYCRVQGYC